MSGEPPPPPPPSQPMSQSRQSLPPPPTPQAETRDALDDLQRAGAAVSSTPATAQRQRSVSLLFPSSVNRPADTNVHDELSSANAQVNTPSQTTSEQSSSRKKKTHNSTSSTASTFAVNRDGCINSFRFTQFRDFFLSASTQYIQNVYKAILLDSS